MSGHNNMLSMTVGSSRIMRGGVFNKKNNVTGYWYTDTVMNFKKRRLLTIFSSSPSTKFQKSKILHDEFPALVN